MQHRKTISLTAKDEQFISAQLEAGQYGNASEVIRAGLRLLEQEQLRLAALRQAIADGDSAHTNGDYMTFTEPGQFATDLKTRLIERQGGAKRR